MPQRDPIITAKSVASLDQLSGGRFIFAIGGGWNVEEMENHGEHYDTRFKLLRERVLAMKALWTQEEAEFHGEHVNFDPVWQYPKPKQKPHPPILLGGETDHTVRRVVEGSPSAQSRGGARPRRRPDATRQRCRLRCSTRRPIGPRSSPIVRPASNASCSRCLT
jgi:alkanesulfonate monooxygenase SsuD/methylene tetrahydromethanopterin reductase-like flavin-dependent oxidoreductase (luciferase family)